MLRTLNFAHDRSIGELSWTPRERGTPRVLSAIGSVHVPQSSVVSLHVSLEGELDLSPIAALPNDAINVISFEPDSDLLITSSHLLPLTTQTALRSLHISENPIDPSAASTIGGLRTLEDLALCHGAITDSFIGPLTRLPCLRSLSIEGNSLSGDVLSGLVSLKSLQWLNIAAIHLTDEYLWFASSLSGLTDLFLDWNPVSDTGLIYLAPLSRLQRLRASHTNITPGGLTALWHVIGEAGGGPRPEITLMWEGPGWYAASARPLPPWDALTPPNILISSLQVLSDDEVAHSIDLLGLTAPQKLRSPSEWHGPVDEVV